jgi:hypothetical protein
MTFLVFLRRTGTVLRASAGTPRTAALTAPRRHGLAGSVVPGSPAPRHTLSATANCSHARLPETHHKSCIKRHMVPLFPSSESL